MTNPRFDPENLVVLDRRGQLDPEQVEALDQLYREDARVLELYRWGRAFDEEALVRPGDEAIVSHSVERTLCERALQREAQPVDAELVARSVERTLRQRERQRAARRGPRSPRLGGWLLAAILIGSTAAAAGVVGWLGRKTDSNGTAASVASAQSPELHRKTSRSGGSNAAEPSESAAHPAPPTGAAENASVQAVTPSGATRAGAEKATASTTFSTPVSAPRGNAAMPSAEPKARPAESLPNSNRESLVGPVEAESIPVRPLSSQTAADLFRSANEARRQGDWSSCVQRYRELQQRFAGSAEARESHVSLGKVLRATGESASALREFTLYLQMPGALEEEALVGRAEVLASLARLAEERATWQRLLTRFPTSVYVPRARQRLNELK